MRHRSDRHLKRNRADSERIIGKYMKITDPKLMATEFDFVAVAHAGLHRADTRRYQS